MNVPETKASIFGCYTPNIGVKLTPSSDEVTVFAVMGATVFIGHNHVVSSRERTPSRCHERGMRMLTETQPEASLDDMFVSQFCAQAIL